MAVHQSLEKATSDVRFAPKLSDACFEDRHNFCSSVPPGSARVLGCLQEKCDPASLRLCHAWMAVASGVPEP